jgi:hypothetical protein
MRTASKLNASTLISANAFFTITALVENNMAPMKVMIKPVSDIFMAAFLFIKK